MKRNRGSRNVLPIIGIIAISLLFIMGYKICIESMQNNKVKKIESNIKEGKYENALNLINSFKNIDKCKKEVVEKIILYKSVINDYLDINNDVSTRTLLIALEEYSLKYNEALSLDVFDNLNIEINKTILESKNIIQRIDEEVNKIKEMIEQDVNKAEELLAQFKIDNPKEDISEIELAINKRKEEIKKAEELHETEKKEQIVIEDDITNNISNNETYNQSKIGEINAAKNSSQLITVVSNGGSYAELVLWQKDGNGIWSEIDLMPARLGANGMKYYGDVYEMDKCTPTGIYTLTEAFGIKSNPGAGVSYRVVDGSEYWVDDVDSQYYNTMQFGEANGRWNSAEHLASWPGYYNYSLVIDYNRWPVIQGKSSAIFLHCDMGVATYGCVAVAEQKLVNILQWINPSSNPKIILDFSYDNIYNNY